MAAVLVSLTCLLDQKARPGPQLTKTGPKASVTNKLALAIHDESAVSPRLATCERMVVLTWWVGGSGKLVCSHRIFILRVQKSPC